MLQRFVGIAAFIGSVVALASGSSALAQQAQAQQPLVDKFVFADTVQPVSQGELIHAIDRANSDGAQALLIEIEIGRAHV
jgi:hypothetical protein